MADNLLKLLPLNDAPAAVRQDLIINAFVGNKSDILGFITGRRVVDSVQTLASERDAAQARAEAAQTGAVTTEARWKDFHTELFTGLDLAKIETDTKENPIDPKPTELGQWTTFVAHVTASEDSAKKVGAAVKRILQFHQ